MTADTNLYDKNRIQAAEKWAEDKLSAMSIEEKIGQMIIVRLAADYSNINNPYVLERVSLIQKYNIGGFYVTSGDPYDVGIMNNYLQDQAKIPLLMCADFESGVGRLIRHATTLPKNMLIAAAYNPELARVGGEITAKEARAIGVSVIFAPVADVNNNPLNPIVNVRSYGSDSDYVAKLVQYYIRGIQENGAAATAKHFPGHGDTSADSHIQMPRLDAGIERLEEVELKPFKAAIEEGVLLMMIAHIAVPTLDIDAKIPASLSGKIITGFLREKLGYDGVVCTDGLDMQAITNSFSVEEAAERAVGAGADLLLISPDPERCFLGVLNAIKNEKIPVSTINNSARRILKLKALLGLHETAKVDINNISRIVSSPENLKWAEKKFEAGITVIKNEDNLLPVKSVKMKKCLCINFFDSNFWDEKTIHTISNELEQRYPGAIELTVPYDLANESAFDIMKIAGRADIVIANIFIKVKPFKGSVGLSLKQIELLTELSRSGNNIVTVVYGSPYIVEKLNILRSIMLCYDFTPETITAGFKAVFGEIPVTGRLPVEIPDLFKLGHGINIG